MYEYSPMSLRVLIENAEILIADAAGVALV